MYGTVEVEEHNMPTTADRSTKDVNCKQDKGKVRSRKLSESESRLKMVLALVTENILVQLVVQ
jgi:hypothetical protein